jgi:hypothetical protein
VGVGILEGGPELGGGSGLCGGGSGRAGGGVRTMGGSVIGGISTRGGGGGGASVAGGHTWRPSVGWAHCTCVGGPSVWPSLRW